MTIAKENCEDCEWHDAPTVEYVAKHRKDLIWPKNKRESDIIKQQSRLYDYFHWYEAGIGFSFGAMFFSACYFIWG